MKQLFYLVIAGYLLFSVAGCSNIASYPISQADSGLYDEGYTGKWKFEEDTNSHNFYAISKGLTPNKYHIKFWDRGGKNPTYEGEAYLSVVNGEKFFNLPCLDESREQYGYLFLKLIDVNKSYSKITAAVVGDVTMQSLRNEEEVYRHVHNNMNKAVFYSDTIHLYKVK